MGIPGRGGTCHGHVSVIEGENAARVSCVHIVSIWCVLHASVHICIHRLDVHTRVYAHIHLVSVLKRVIPCLGKPAPPQPPWTQWRLWEDVGSGPSDKPGAWGQGLYLLLLRIMWVNVGSMRHLQVWEKENPGHHVVKPSSSLTLCR